MRTNLRRCSLSIIHCLTVYNHRIWSDKRLTLVTKLRIYQTLVLFVLLYATDTWTLLSADVRTLDAFHQKCLRQLLGIRWYDRVRSDEVGYYNGPVWLHSPISYPVDASRYLGMWLDLTTWHRQTWLFSSTSTYHSTDLLTARGVAHQVVHRTTGSTSYETIPPVQLESSGGVLSTVDMVVQRRVGPRRLRDHDDDDDGHWLDWQLVTFAKYFAMRFQVIKSQRQ